jgi:hypothetical protein
VKLYNTQYYVVALLPETLVLVYRKTARGMINQDNLEDQKECERLRKENLRLRAMLGIQNSTPGESSQTAIPAAMISEGGGAGPPTPERRIALFRCLFRGREDVYAVPWEGKNGRSGYSPAGAIDWRAIHAASPEERRLYERHERFNRSQIAQSAITPLEADHRHLPSTSR